MKRRADVPIAATPAAAGRIPTSARAGGRMNKCLLGAMAVMFLSGALVPGQAKAQSSERVDSACSTSLRVSADDATCLTAEWSNSGLNSSYDTTNNCSSYGKLIVSVDVKVSKDFKLTLPKNYAYSWGGTITGAHVREVTCCASLSDLCYKDEVEADDSGRIKSRTYSGSNHTVTFVNVATHYNRYQFCKDNSDNIYCTVDPEGDANTDPTPDDGSCDDGPCTLKDCKDKFAESYAATNSAYDCDKPTFVADAWLGDPNATDRSESKWVLTDNTCNITGATCTLPFENDTRRGINAWDETHYGNTDFEIAMNIHDMPDLRFCRWITCDGETRRYRYGLYDDACPEDVPAGGCTTTDTDSSTTDTDSSTTDTDSGSSGS